MRQLLSLLLLFVLGNLWGQNNQISNRYILDTLKIETYGNYNFYKRLPKTIKVIKLSSIQKAAIESLDDVLNLVAGIDMRVRGSKGVQADLSMRGGNFDQVLILLNGVKINNPQTGHHSLDLPVDISMLDRIEILEGASGQSFGVNAYSGAINLITKNPQREQANSSLKIGQFGYIKTDFDLAHSFDKLSVYNGFSYQRSTGYLPQDSINNTDFYALKDFINIHYSTVKFPMNLQVGYHQKAFGAHSFYTAKFPWQFEKTQGYFAAFSAQSGQKIIIKPSLKYRLYYDEFQLFRESVYTFQDGFFIHQKDTAQYAPGIYYPGHNYHKNQQLSAQVRVQTLTKWGHSFLNLSLQNDRIWSNKLGHLLLHPIVVSDRLTYSRFARRSYFEAQMNQVKKWPKMSVGLGLNLLYEPAFHWQINGGGYINYRQEHWTHYANISTASRLPTFTDLYYQGPANIGNPDLKPEISVTYEAGSKYFDRQNYFTGSLFLRQSKHTIDWIKFHPADKWQPHNLTQLQTLGFEMTASHRFNKGFFKKIALSYTYLTMAKNESQYFISKYVMDYLKHKAHLEIAHNFLYHTVLYWTLVYKNRNGQYLNYIDKHYQLVDYKPYIITNLKLNKQLNRMRIGLSIENLFNIKYNDLSYIRMPGRWVIFEFNYKVK